MIGKLTQCRLFDKQCFQFLYDFTKIKPNRTRRLTFLSSVLSELGFHVRFISLAINEICHRTEDGLRKVQMNIVINILHMEKLGIGEMVLHRGNVVRFSVTITNEQSRTVVCVPFPVREINEFIVVLHSSLELIGKL